MQEVVDAMSQGRVTPLFAAMSSLRHCLDGDAPAFSHCDLGDFRDASHQRLLVVEESC